MLFAQHVADGFPPSRLKAKLKGEETQGQQADTKRLRPSTAEHENTAPPGEYKAACSKRDDADLCAQRRMAQSAEAQVRQNEFGLTLLLLTLLATGAAAFASMVTVVVMTRTARRQLRAYVNVTQITISNLTTSAADIRIDFKNYGQTPAYKVGTRVKLILETEVRTDFSGLPDVSEIHGDLAPQATFWAIDKIGLHDDAPLEIRNGITHLRVYGDVAYVDAFGRKHVTTFNVCSERDTFPNMRSLPHGNSST